MIDKPPPFKGLNIRIPIIILIKDIINHGSGLAFALFSVKLSKSLPNWELRVKGLGIRVEVRVQGLRIRVLGLAGRFSSCGGFEVSWFMLHSNKFQ